MSRSVRILGNELYCLPLDFFDHNHQLPRKTTVQMLHPRDFYEAIALGIDAENKKASVYIKHPTSIGAARELILRDVLLDTTPAPFRLGTGLVHGSDNGEHTTSRQCDVLIYNPTINPPKYAFDNFVVLDPGTALVNIEVKSMLNEEAFTQASQVAHSTWNFSIPTLAFAYDSVGLDAISNYIVQAIKSRQNTIPWCIAVHSKNFLYVRPRTISNGHQCLHLLINCSEAEDTHHGLATSVFLQLYDAWLRNRCILSSENLYAWYNNIIDIPDNGRRFFDENGTRHNGAIPLA